jgi:hypothetical protein
VEKFADKKAAEIAAALLQWGHAPAICIISIDTSHFNCLMIINLIEGLSNVTRSGR